MKYRRTATMLIGILLFVQSCFLAMAADGKSSLSMNRQKQEVSQENTDCYKLILAEQSTVSFHFGRISVTNLPVKWQIHIYNAHREKIADFFSEKENQEHLILKLPPETYYIKIVFGCNPYHMTVKTSNFSKPSPTNMNASRPQILHAENKCLNVKNEDILQDAQKIR